MNILSCNYYDVRCIDLPALAMELFYRSQIIICHVIRLFERMVTFITLIIIRISIIILFASIKLLFTTPTSTNVNIVTITF